jgi:hypothetical protein
MIRHSIIGLILLSASVTPSVAGVIVNSTTVTTFAPPDALLTGHTGYILSLQTDDGSLISAVEVNITGRLHQRWNYVEDEFAFVPTPRSLNITNGDSHLLIPTNGLIPVNPTENNNITQSPLADTATRDYGYGNFLKGVWGIPGASQSNRIDFAYLVVPNGSLPPIGVAGAVATSNGVFQFGLGSVGPILTSNPVVGPGKELVFQLPFQGGPAPLPIALANSGNGVINVNSITLAGPHASQFALVGTLPTTLTGFLPAHQFGVKPIYPLPGGMGDLMAVVQVRTDWGNLDFDVLLKVPEPSTLLLTALAIVGLAIRVRR